MDKTPPREVRKVLRKPPVEVVKEYVTKTDLLVWSAVITLVILGVSAFFGTDPP